jgi:branched-subunit amino acid aminotransferase/4-amino-4-deoxychorismate lyase
MSMRVESNKPLPPPGAGTYGHYTAMQVRGGAVRGLALHLARLDGATRELFDRPLDTERVRGHLRHALRDSPDASAGVYVYWPDPNDDEPTIAVVTRPPAPQPGMRQRLKSVPYQRPVAHLKHLGSFAQSYFGRQAARDGFDDALLTGPDGVISEAAVANVAFLRGDEVVWPDAPQLPGITMQLIEPRLRSVRASVRLADLPTFDGAVVTNSHGVGGVARIDDVRFAPDDARVRQVAAEYEAVPWDTV